MSSDQLPVKEESKREAIAKLLTAVNNQYRVVWDAMALELAVNCFEFLDLNDLKQALQLWVLESRWPPTISDINQYYARIQQEKRRWDEEKREDEQRRELAVIKQLHEKTEKRWRALSGATRGELLREAEAHPMSEYMSAETVAKNILLFGKRKLLRRG